MKNSILFLSICFVLAAIIISPDVFTNAIGEIGLPAAFLFIGSLGIALTSPEHDA